MRHSPWPIPRGAAVMPQPHDLQVPSLCMRREFLRIGGGLAVAGLFSPLASGPATAAGQSSRTYNSARSCILIYLLGGPPHLDMWDLKPGAPAEIRGPFRPISTTLPGRSEER